MRQVQCAQAGLHKGFLNYSWVPVHLPYVQTLKTHAPHAFLLFQFHLQESLQGSFENNNTVPAGGYFCFIMDDRLLLLFYTNVLECGFQKKTEIS
jgi:hypothetical protein